MKKFYMVCFLGVIVLFSGCGSSDRIEGKVEDVFGNPVSGVIATVDKTTFTSKTDSGGKYSLDYAAGAFDVVYKKDGYVTMRVPLDIHEKSHYPVQTMVLYPNPGENSFSYVNFDKQGLVELSVNGKIKVRTVGKVFAPQLIYYVYPPKNTPVLYEGENVFIDTIPYAIELLKIKNNKIFDATQGHILYDGTVNSEVYKELANGKILRTVKLEPGYYAWIKNPPEAVLPYNYPCRVFKVIEKDKYKSKKNYK